MEAQQGVSFKAQPLTLVADRVDCERVVDLTDPLVLSAIGITLETLGSLWVHLSICGLSPPTWGLAKQVIQSLSLIHISEPTRLLRRSRMPSSA